MINHNGRNIPFLPSPGDLPKERVRWSDGLTDKERMHAFLENGNPMLRPRPILPGHLANVPSLYLAVSVVSLIGLFGVYRALKL